MARVLIVDRQQRAEEFAAALESAGYAVRAVDPGLAGDVVDALDNVAVVAYLLGADADPAAHDEMLATVLLKVVDTGVRGFVYERAAAGETSRHVEHARETWHLSVAEVDPGVTAQELVDASNRALGI